MTTEEMIKAAELHQGVNGNAIVCLQSARNQFQKMKLEQDQEKKDSVEVSARYWAHRSLLHSIGCFEMARIYNLPINL